MPPKDLWGNPIQITNGGRGGAYPAPPGTGPAGKTCRDCRHKRKGGSGLRSHPKCALVKETCGRGTDIKVGSPACRLFEQKPLERA